MKIQKIIGFCCLNTIFFVFTHGQTQVPQKVQDKIACIVTQDGKPTEQLTELFNYFKIQHNGTLKDMALKAAEKWALQDNFNPREKLNISVTNDISPLISKLGLIDAIEFTSQKFYKYAVVVGGFVSTVKSRISYLKKFWDQGIRFEKIIFLTGQRALHIERDSVKELCTDSHKTIPSHLQIKKDWEFNNKASYKTEYDMVKLVYDQLDLPQEMRALPVVFVNATSYSFPYRSNCIKTWLETHPEPGDCLAVVNQPYVTALYVAFKNILPKDFKIIDVVGYAIDKQYHSAEIWLEGIASFLYEECLRQI
jgi:hypothetical protein